MYNSSCAGLGKDYTQTQKVIIALHRVKCYLNPSDTMAPYAMQSPMLPDVSPSHSIPEETLTLHPPHPLSQHASCSHMHHRTSNRAANTESII